MYLIFIISGYWWDISARKITMKVEDLLYAFKLFFQVFSPDEVFLA